MKKKKRIGRGGKRGTYSGKGQKGQRARAGKKIRPQEREEILKIPKHRGTGFVNRPKKFAARIFLVSLEKIERAFKNGRIVSPKTLMKAGMIPKIRKGTPDVKVLGGAALTKKLSFVGVSVSSAAREAIEAAGGSVR